MDSFSNVPNNGSEPGKGVAIGSLVCGILSVVFWWFGITSIISLILGIVGLVLASSAKSHGFVGGLRTAGFVLSIIGTIGGAIVFVSCVACAGCVGVMGGLF